MGQDKSASVVIHQCFKMCKCDMDGEVYYGLSDGRIIKESEITEELKKQSSWGSSSCSKCGQISYLKDGGY